MCNSFSILLELSFIFRSTLGHLIKNFGKSTPDSPTRNSGLGAEDLEFLFLLAEDFTYDIVEEPDIEIPQWYINFVDSDKRIVSPPPTIEAPPQEELLLDLNKYMEREGRLWRQVPEPAETFLPDDLQMGRESEVDTLTCDQILKKLDKMVASRNSPHLAIRSSGSLIANPNLNSASPSSDVPIKSEPHDTFYAEMWLHCTSQFNDSKNQF